MKGCTTSIGLLISAVLLIACIQGLHGHFSKHAEAIAAMQQAIQVAANAKAAAAEQARHEAQVRENHERRLEWQQTHPMEYARQLEQQREAEQRAAQAAVVEKHRRMQAQQLADAERRNERRKEQEIANHEKRSAIQAYWNPVINQLGVAQAGLNFAIAAVANGDLGSASSLVAKASEIAGQAANTASENKPDDFDDVESDLQNSAMSFKSALDDMHDYLDDQKPSTAAKAEQEGQDARDAAALAVHIVRQKYVELGGSWNDIHDVQQAGTDATKLMTTLTGDGNN